VVPDKTITRQRAEPPGAFGLARPGRMPHRDRVFKRLATLSANHSS
jgi:hypothetical protein